MRVPYQDSLFFKENERKKRKQPTQNSRDVKTRNAQPNIKKIKLAKPI